MHQKVQGTFSYMVAQINPLSEVFDRVGAQVLVKVHIEHPCAVAGGVLLRIERHKRLQSLLSNSRNSRSPTAC